jgi:threonyl-tRNA synthetase
VAIVTRRDDDALELLRHDAAHVMAQAVQELYPGTQVTIGPAIENGFYYDFARDEPFTPDDLAAIEQRMHEIVKRDLPIKREVWDREQAKRRFGELGETYKVEIIDDIIPEGEEVSIYRQGDWFDVCRGPHLPSTGKLGNGFKLTKVAGAYWRGDSATRCCSASTAPPGATRRSSRPICTGWRRPRSATIASSASSSTCSISRTRPRAWPSGTTRAVVYREVERYMREKLDEYGYQEVETPQVLDRSLWERSGHWEKFADDMFTTHLDDRDYAIKPMNCPGHIQLFNQGLKSYRDLPLRIAEFGVVHRNEPSAPCTG